MIYTIGEVVLDIIIKNLNQVQVKPGGSMLNTAISLGRLGLPVNHLSVISHDKASDLLIEFLEENHVGHKTILRYNEIKTNLALAFLDKNNNAQYSFYKERFRNYPQFKFPKPATSDFIHFGSFFSLNPEFYPQLEKFLANAKKANSVVLYDPNFRKPHLNQLEKLSPIIQKNIENSSIIKGSNEDFENIYNITTGEETWNLLKTMGPKILIYTKGGSGVELFSNNFHIEVPAIPVSTISTIGAGDTFSAGIIYQLSRFADLKKTFLDLSPTDWKFCLETAVQFASETCQSYDNYLSVAYIKKYLNV